jgi:hypothetical protein
MSIVRYPFLRRPDRRRTTLALRTPTAAPPTVDGAVTRPALSWVGIWTAAAGAAAAAAVLAQQAIAVHGFSRICTGEASQWQR